jgi:hypothetical protein
MRFLFSRLNMFLVILIVLGTTIATAQDARPVYLPLVAHGLSSEPPAQVVTLVGHDTTFVAATLIPDTCRVIVTYVDRANGNIVHVTEHVGDRLVEIPLPTGVTLAGEAPNDELPGLKHASASPIVVCGMLRIYANVRVEDGGPFVLQVLEMPAPAPNQGE